MVQGSGVTSKRCATSFLVVCQAAVLAPWVIACNVSPHVVYRHRADGGSNWVGENSPVPQGNADSTDPDANAGITDTDTDDSDSEPDAGGDTNEFQALDGPAAALVIDASVHTGVGWDGAATTGVWNDAFDFRMDRYPTSWAIALVHASHLLRTWGIDYSPNAVLSVALKESRLGNQSTAIGCGLQPPSPTEALACSPVHQVYGDGFFQIESGTAYSELQRVFGRRFVADHADTVAGWAFPTAALTLVHYTLFSAAMLQLHHPDPMAFFAAHPDPRAQQQMLSAAYNRGLWWPGLTRAFAECHDRSVTECFTEGAAQSPQRIAIDHAEAIADYTQALDASPPFDRELRWQDIEFYWQDIAPLYPDIDPDVVLTVVHRAFSNAARTQSGNTDETIRFNRHLGAVVSALVSALPALPPSSTVTAAVCELGYLHTTPPCP